MSWRPYRTEDLMARLKAIENGLSQVSAQLAALQRQGGADQTLGGGQQAVINATTGGSGSGSGGVSTLSGDVTGPASQTVVERIREVTIPAPAAGDDERYVRYQHGTPAFEYGAIERIQDVPIPAPDAGDDGKFIQYAHSGPAYQYTAIDDANLALLGTWHEADISAIGTSDAEMDNALAGATGVAVANPMPDAGELVALAVKLTGDVGGAGNDLIVTVYLNGVATALTATITGAGATEDEATTIVSPIAFAAGDDITVFAREVGTCAAVRAIVTVWGRAQTTSAGDETHTAVYASRPAGATGDLFLPTDSYQIERNNAGTWAPWGPLMPFTAPPSAGWSWVNQGGASVDTSKGGIFLTGPAAASDSLRLYMRTIPAAPYVVTVAILPRLVFPANFIACGLALRESGTGEVMTFGPVSDTARSAATAHGLIVSATKWASATAFSAHYTLVPANPLVAAWQMGPCLWLQIEDDNTNRILRVSNDGQRWYQLFSVSRTDFLTPDQIGIVVNSNNAAHTAGMLLLSWEE